MSKNKILSSQGLTVLESSNILVKQYKNILSKIKKADLKEEIEKMENVNVIEKKVLKDDVVSKVSHIKTDLVGQDTYYFKAAQVLDWHRHPEGDQLFFVHEGKGTFYIDDGTEETVEIGPGSVVLAPKNVWHKIVAEDELVVSQATTQPAGMEVRG
jgi:quercetin dioxygenase-like cupin family protein